MKWDELFRSEPPPPGGLAGLRRKLSHSPRPRAARPLRVAIAASVAASAVVWSLYLRTADHQVRPAALPPVGVWVEGVQRQREAVVALSRAGDEVPLYWVMTTN